MKEKILLLGSGGHAKSVADALEASGTYEITGFLEREEKRDFSYRGLRVIGRDEDIPYFFKQGITNAFVTVGYMGQGGPRERLYEILKKTGYRIPVIVDPSAVIAADARIGEGSFIGKAAVVNAGAVVGRMCIVNTSAVIEHDCRIGDFTHISVSAVCCGGARAGRLVMVGANATLLQGISVGDGAVIGAGSVVLHDVEAGRTAAGNPARLLRSADGTKKEM